MDINQIEQGSGVNPFFLMYGSVSFKPITGTDRTPYEYKTGKMAGTKQTRLAEVFVEIGNGRTIEIPSYDAEGKETVIRFQVPTTDNYIDGGHIVLLELPNGAKSFKLNWPSSGKDFKRPTFKAADERGEALMDEFRASVVDAWKKWQAERVKTGKLKQAEPQAMVGTSSNDDELKALGLA